MGRGVGVTDSPPRGKKHPRVTRINLQQQLVESRSKIIDPHEKRLNVMCHSGRW